MWGGVDTNLKQLLDATGKKGVVVVGYQVHVGVGATVRAAHDYGYDLAVARDCVGVREGGIDGASADQVLDVELKILHDTYCTVLDSKQIK